MAAPRKAKVVGVPASAHPLLKRSQAAELLGVHYDSIRAAVRGGRLRELRLPAMSGHRSLPRYRREDVDAFVAAGYTQGLR